MPIGESAHSRSLTPYNPLLIGSIPLDKQKHPGPAPLAPTQLSPADFAQLAFWLSPPSSHPVDPRAACCEWGKVRCGQRLDMTAPSAHTFRHLQDNHPDVHIRTQDYHNLTCKWKHCGMRADFRNAADAEDWLHLHILEHSGARAAMEGRTLHYCKLCKRTIDLYKGSLVEHIRRCITETLFLNTAEDLRNYGVAETGFNLNGDWTKVYVRATGEEHA